MSSDQRCVAQRVVVEQHREVDAGHIEQAHGHE
jgi:hypothetical protein